MKWVTRDYIHLDRMACVWLIKRFVDHEAEFTFVPWGKEDTRPQDAIAFSIPHTELSPHDASGTTFKKIIHKYNLKDDSLDELAVVIQKGVDHVLHGFHPEHTDRHGQVAVGLLAVSEGLMLTCLTDEAIVMANTPIYDALYHNFKAHDLVRQQKLTIPKNQLGPSLSTDFLRQVLSSHLA